MTICTRINDGRLIHVEVYRGVVKGKNYSDYLVGFYAQQDTNKWGIMYQLKGKERIILAHFGKIPMSMKGIE